MNPDGPIALVVAAGGLIVGIIGLVQASRARRSALEANEVARKANELSGEANGIAREANEISHRADTRAHERHDVSWDADLVDEGVLAVRNRGRDTAHQVLIRVTFDNEAAVEVEADEVAGHGEQCVHLPSVRTRLLVDRADEAKSAPRGAFPSVKMPSIYYLDIEVTWTSDSGRGYNDSKVGGVWSSLEPVSPTEN